MTRAFWPDIATSAAHSLALLPSLLNDLDSAGEAFTLKGPRVQ